MNRLPHLKILACLLAIVLMSGSAGFMIGHKVAWSEMARRNNLENWNEHVAREFERIVKPSVEQDTRIQAHLDRAVRELEEIRLQTIGRSTNVIWHLVADVERELTPQQRLAFEAMKPKPADLSLDVLKVKPVSESGP